MNADNNRIIVKRNEPETTMHLTIRNTKTEAISKSILLQEESSLYLVDWVWLHIASWRLAKPYRIFPQRQLVAVEPDSTLVRPASTLIISLRREHAEDTLCKITADSIFTNRDPNEDGLNAADISIHLKYRHWRGSEPVMSTKAPCSPIGFKMNDRRRQAI